jgi:hypothetical protein
MRFPSGQGATLHGPDRFPGEGSLRLNSGILLPSPLSFHGRLLKIKFKPHQDFIDLIIVFAITALAITILFLAMPGCEVSKLESDIIKVDTRGIPIVRVVIEGPGYDLVPVEYERTYNTGLILLNPTFLAFLFGVGLTTMLALLLDKKRKKD